MRTLKFETPKQYQNFFGNRAVLPVSDEDKVEIPVNLGKSKLADTEENRLILESLHIPYALS